VQDPWQQWWIHIKYYKENLKGRVQLETLDVEKVLLELLLWEQGWRYG
jgi:hypothetical protein